jgi:hypothetical protein
MGNIDYLSDNLIELQGPVNMATGLPVSTIATTSSVTAKLYDTSLDGRLFQYASPLIEDAAAAATSVFILDTAPVAVGSTVLIQMDNGQEDEQVVTDVDAGTGEVTFGGGTLTAAASEGKRLTITTYHADSTVIAIDDFRGWSTGMNMEITAGDGSLVERTVSLIDKDSGYLTISSSLGVDTAHGALIKRKLGADLTGFVDYGTFPTSDPVIGDPEWGMRDVIEYNHADIEPGMRVRGEITLIDTTPTPDLNLTRKVVATVINE